MLAILRGGIRKFLEGSGWARVGEEMEGRWRGALGERADDTVAVSRTVDCGAGRAPPGDLDVMYQPFFGFFFLSKNWIVASVC